MAKECVEHTAEDHTDLNKTDLNKTKLSLTSYSYTVHNICAQMILSTSNWSFKLNSVEIKN